MAIVATAEAERVMKRCQIGTRNYNEANDLHAECYGTIGALVQERDMLRTGDTCARQCECTAYRIEARQQKRRADVLAATIRELCDVVTHGAETKAEFIARVRAILSADPDARVTPNAKLSGLEQRRDSTDCDRSRSNDGLEPGGTN